MIFHVGVDPLHGVICAYNSETMETNTFETDKVLNDEQIPLIFKEIKDNISEELGSVCICLDNRFDFHSRKLFLQHGLGIGFANVEIIDDKTAMYFSALFSTVYRPCENDLMFLSMNEKCFIWQQKGDKAEMLDIIFNIEVEALEKTITKWCSKKSFNNIVVLMHEREIEEENSNAEILSSKFNNHEFNSFENIEIINDVTARYSRRKSSSKFEYYAFSFESYAKAAMIKSLLIAGDNLCKLITLSDAAPSLQLALAVIVEKKELVFFDYYQKLPTKQSTEIKKNKSDRLLYIVSWSDKMKIEQSLFLPAFQNFLLTIIIDTNGLFHMDLERINQLLTKDLEEELIFFSHYTSRGIPLIKAEAQFVVPVKLDINGERSDAVGIDLGTTRCCAAVVRKKTIETVPLENSGGRFISSYVAFDEETEKCGKIAVERMRNHAESSVFGTKNIIGKPFNKLKMDETWPFKVVHKNNSVHLELQDYQGKTSKFPEEISAALLKHIKQVSEEHQGKQLHEVVISCPVTFTTAQTDATYIAALLAGWKKVYFITDNTAILASYIFKNEVIKNALLLIFDLGAQTLDLSIVEIVEDKKIMICINKDIGGKDFDAILYKYFSDKLANVFKITEFGDKKYKFFSSCQKIKEDLSVDNEAFFDVEEIDMSQPEFIPLSRKEFEILTSELVNEIETFIINSLNQKKYLVSHFDKILLSGGGSRMPMIKKILSKTFPTAQLWCDTNPDEMVAVGACYTHYYSTVRNQ